MEISKGEIRNLEIRKRMKVECYEMIWRERKSSGISK